MAIPHNALDLVGQRFGRLVVEKRGPAARDGKARWLCKCDCGGTSSPMTSQLRGGKTRSCGCLSRERLIERSMRHGGAKRGAHSPEYSVWEDMRKRCANPAHKFFNRYGGRGIAVCPRWDDFGEFLADMGPRPPGHTLERTDNDADYTPGNCVWATRTAQNRNRSNTRRITVDGITLSIPEWAERTGLSYYTIYLRLRRGMPPAQAVSTGQAP